MYDTLSNFQDVLAVLVFKWTSRSLLFTAGTFIYRVDLLDIQSMWINV